ncbi:hypothetical protein N7451_011483 [Penicillium sp. IBT 35674x]|nr:hypothetical protein N7451_011483 [Penicillium sp. IBT 35674x]
MLQLIQRGVQEMVELSLSPGQARTELLESHDLVIHDKLEQLSGATSHEVRDRFNDWVAGQLPKVVKTHEVLQRLMEEHERIPDFGPEYSLGARFNFALFVDDVCLESLVHMDQPVVKILYKQWGNLTLEERKYEIDIDPDWHDGVTEEEEEDVGWMYMSVVDYVDMYDKFEWAHTGVWHDTYLRPPQMMDYYNDRERQPGFWRA